MTPPEAAAIASTPSASTRDPPAATAAPEALETAQNRKRRADEALAQLLSMRADAERRRIELDEQRRHAALEGLTGDDKARRHLADVTSAALALNMEAGNIAAAMEAAQAAVAEADAALARAEFRRRAQEARERLTEMREAGDAASEALDHFMGRLERFAAIGNDIRRLGIGGMPSTALQRVGTRRALDTLLMRVGLAESLVAPAARTSLSNLVTGWAAQVETHIAAALGETTEDAA